MRRAAFPHRFLVIRYILSPLTLIQKKASASTGIAIPTGADAVVRCRSLRRLPRFNAFA
jgi:hypothetical protein